MSDLTFLTAHELTQRYRDRALSPVELTDHVLSRIERLDGQLNAFVHLDAASARAAARVSEGRFARGEARVLEGFRSPSRICSRCTIKRFSLFRSV